MKRLVQPSARRETWWERYFPRNLPNPYEFPPLPSPRERLPIERTPEYIRPRRNQVSRPMPVLVAGPARAGFATTRSDVCSSERESGLSIPSWWAPTVADFERKADSAVAGLPLALTSWGRSRTRNRACKGSSDSQHLIWTAADFTGPRWALEEARKRALAQGLGYALIEEKPLHLHIQLFKKGDVPNGVMGKVAAP